MENNENPTERTCPVCGSGFVPETPKQKYCNARCRRAHYEKRQEQQAQELAQKARQQKAQLDKLAADAQAPAIPVPAIHSEWQVLDQACQTLQANCREKGRKGEKLDQEIRKLTEPGPGFGWGAWMGIFLFLIGIGLYYEYCRRHRQGLGMPFWVILLGGVVPIGLVGSVLGQRVENELKSEAQKQQLTEKLAELVAKRTALTEWLRVAYNKLDDLKSARDKVAKYGPTGATPLNEAPLTPPDPA